jgi:serine/threonine-protein kinase
MTPATCIETPHSGMSSTESAQDLRVDCFGDIPETRADAENYYGIDLRPGQILDGRFRLLRVISHSGMASIFEAQDLKDGNKLVAIKVPQRRLESNVGFFARFLREEEIGLSLNHPLILKFISSEDKKRAYIVTEYLRGSTLSQLLWKHTPLPEKDAFRIIRILCEALKYLHNKGVVHRDLKPGNIMICCDRTMRLMDFGLATQDEYRKITLQGMAPMLGTPDYTSPEQVLNQKTDARTDIYSVGIILYEMLTGVVPFANENAWVAMNDRVTGDPAAPRSLNPAISREAEEIVLHCMRRNPAERYQCVEELIKELEAPEKVTVTGYALNLKKPHWRFGYRSTPILFGVAAAVAFILFQIAAFFVFRHFYAVN